MKKLQLLLFLMPNLVMAETWVCVYEDGSIAKYERSGNKFMFMDMEFGPEIIFENDEYLYLSNASSTGKLGYNKNMIINKNNKTMLHTFNSDNAKKSWFQYMDCEVVE